MSRMRKYVATLLALILVSGLSFKCLGESDSKPLQDADSVVNTFYESLLSDTAITNCPDIFLETTSVANVILRYDKDAALAKEEKPLSIIWSYLRRNKALFLFPIISSERTVRKTVRSYSFSNYVGGGVDDSKMTITLFAPLSHGGTNGIMKEVAFPLVRSTSSDGHYVLNVAAMNVNGMYVTPEYKRKDEFSSSIGFRNK